MVAGVDDHRVLREPILVEVRQDLADALVHRLHRRQVILHVSLVLPAYQLLAAQRHAGPVARDGHRLGLDEPPPREVRPTQPRGRRKLEVAIVEVLGHALLVLVQRVGARFIVVPERLGLRNAHAAEVRRVLVVRVPRPMRRLVMHHQEERLALGPRLQEVDRQIGDDVGDVAAGVGRLRGRRIEHGVVVDALAGEDVPRVKTLRIAAKVPLANHAGVVAALLQQARHRLA